MTERSCGSCSLCCKLPIISDLTKPADTWCKHCKPGRGGCTIYANRPKVCVDFRCEWLKGHVDEFWKPLDSKMILNVSEEDGERFMNVMVDTGFPNRWREQPYYRTLKLMATVGMLPQHKSLVRVYVGQRTWIILHDQDVEIPPGTVNMTVMRNKAGFVQLVFQ